jgi:hypothetical protein
MYGAQLPPGGFAGESFSLDTTLCESDPRLLSTSWFYYVSGFATSVVDGGSTCVHGLPYVSGARLTEGGASMHRHKHFHMSHLSCPVLLVR